jgi:hypothetical protein
LEGVDMAKTAATVLIERGPEQVWRFIADLSNSPKMYPDVIEVSQTSPGPWGKDMTFSGKIGRRTFLWRVIEYEPKRKFAYEFVSPKLVKGTIDNYSLETFEGKTRLTETLDLKLGGIYWFMSPFLARRAKRDVRARLSRVKTIIESEAL